MYKLRHLWKIAIEENAKTQTSFFALPSMDLEHFDEIYRVSRGYGALPKIVHAEYLGECEVWEYPRK